MTAGTRNQTDKKNRKKPKSGNKSQNWHNQLRGQFTRSFDPSQARQVMGEQSPRRDPNQRRIFWVSQ